MHFLTLSSADVDFLDWKPWWKIYTIEETLPTTRYVKLEGKKKFAAEAFYPEHKTYIVHVGSVNSVASPSFSLFELNVHPFRRPQVSGLIVEKVLTKVVNEYVNFADVFFLDLAFELSKHTGIHNHIIKLVDS